MSGTRARALEALFVATLAAASVAASGWAREAGAQERPPFDWSAPAECPSSGEVLDDVRHALGASTRAPVAARIVVVRAADRAAWTADLTLSAHGETSTRHVEGDTCRGVADAVALIVAFATAAEPEPAPAPPPVPARTIEGGSTRAQGRRVSPSIGVGASFLFDTATLPSTSYGADVALAWQPSRLRFEVDGALLAPVRGTVTTKPSEGADFLLWHAGLRASYGLFGGRFELAPSAGAGIDWTVAKGFGSESPKDATGTSGDFLFGGRASFAVVPRFVVAARADAAVPTTRPTYVVDGTGTVYRPPSVSFRGAVGAEVLF